MLITETSINNLYKQNIMQSTLSEQITILSHKSLFYTQIMISLINIMLGLKEKAYDNDFTRIIFILGCIRLLYTIVDCVATLKLVKNTIAHNPEVIFIKINGYYGSKLGLYNFYFSNIRMLWIVWIKIVLWFIFFVINSVIVLVGPSLTNNINNSWKSIFTNYHGTVTSYFVTVFVATLFPSIFYTIYLMLLTYIYRSRTR